MQKGKSVTNLKLKLKPLFLYESTLKSIKYHGSFYYEKIKIHSWLTTDQI